MNKEKIDKDIEKKLQQQYAIAKKAKELGVDPSKEVEVKLAKNLAQRVIGIVSVAAPQLNNNNIIERIQELEKEYPILDWRIACIIALEIAQQKYCTFQTKKEAIEAGIRVGFAYVTVGVVSAPLEGFTHLELKQTKNNKEYFCMHFAGPIRNAGGTGASVSVIIADYIRKHMDYTPYDPTQKEIQRTVTEVKDYHSKITNLQYNPSSEELEKFLQHCPIQISGNATERIEVSLHKDLKRIPTNFIRGGMCLMYSECLPAKAPKLYKQLKKWGKEFNLEQWNFLEKIVQIQQKYKTNTQTESSSFISEALGGRPTVAYPKTIGGFRLRYGRTRVSGYSTQAIHPATMELLGGFFAIGTQVRTEKPGKATIFTTCDTIEGPIVQLKDGTVQKITTRQQAKEIQDQLHSILYLGDVLINYGDFLDRAQQLLPVGYCHEWWQQEANYNDQKTPTYQQAKEIAENNIPMHPDYTYYWNSITSKELETLRSAIPKLITNALQAKNSTKKILEKLGVEHKVVNSKVELNTQNKEILKDIFEQTKTPTGNTLLEKVNSIAPYTIKDKSGTFLGARMGRPEKAKPRSIKGGIHSLYPIGKELKNLEAINKNTLELIEETLKNLNQEDIPIDMRGVDKKQNANENLAKGILRVKHNLTVNKDGTLRYDATEAAITHFKPSEIQTNISQLKKLGYTHDIQNKPLEKEDQILALHPQDIIFPVCPDSPDKTADVFFTQATQFIDELLKELYKTDPYYNTKSNKQLIGQLIIGLAPHTSAGMVGRIIGFSKTQTLLAHPFFHAAMRRDTDGDESGILLLLDALLNFSLNYLPKQRGSTMDAPLVITSKLIASQVDDMAFNIDKINQYPLELYQAAQNKQFPWDVKINTIQNELNTDKEYQSLDYTHQTTDINNGNLCSIYKTIPSMMEKVKLQLALGSKIEAVDQKDAVQKLVNSHFLKDIKGNLRKFSQQQFRCTKCKQKYRRPPLSGQCSCGGNIIQTVTKGSIVKYLDPAIELSAQYKADEYLQEQLKLLKQQIQLTFQETQEKQQVLT